MLCSSKKRKLLALYIFSSLLFTTSRFSRLAAAVPDLYWESPIRLSRGIGAYPQAIKTKNRISAIWQELSPDNGGGAVYLSMASFGPEGMTRKDRFAGPFRYEAVGDKAKGEGSLNAPVLFSAAYNENKAIIAISSGEENINLYESSDGGASFSASKILKTDGPTVAPRVFAKGGGGWYLFVTRSQVFSRSPAGGGAAVSYESLSLFYTSSDNGVDWEPFKPFVSGEVGLDPNFLPSATFLGNRDYVVFQSLTGGERPSYQIFSMYSDDKGKSWSNPRLISDFSDPINKTSPYNNFDNQRPHLKVIGTKLMLAWERSLRTGKTQIYSAELDKNAGPIEASIERVSIGQGNSFEPRIFSIDNSADAEAGIVWFDDRRGSNRIFVAFKSGALWSEKEISGSGKIEASFGRAMYMDKGLYAFWQSGSGSSSSVNALIPDSSVSPPKLSAVDFKPGEASRRNKIQVSWQVPEDSSGIMGFSWLWSQDPNAVPAESIIALETTTKTSLEASLDGSWYFSLRARDYAGNWSDTSRIHYIRDTSPPGLAVPVLPELTNDGFLASNSFTLKWEAPPDNDLAGYSWNMEYLGALDRLPARKRLDSDINLTNVNYNNNYLLPVTDYEFGLWNKKAPAVTEPYIKTEKPEAFFSNIDDGYWAFSVAAIDRVGNIGNASRIILRADKFQPYTTIRDVSIQRDDFGSLSLTLVGRGFLEDGPVSRLVIDSDGLEPYDRVLELSDKAFSIVSDRILKIPELADLPAGTYRLGVYHNVRGWYFSAPRLSVDVTGTVKFGEPGQPWKPVWRFEELQTPLIKLSTIIIIASLVLPALGVLLSLRQLAIITGELRMIRQEAIAILEGKPMPDFKGKKAAAKAVRKGLGLSAKFTFTISLLVIFVVLLVSVPIGLRTLQTQSEILASGLESRAKVLLESAAQGAKSYLPAANILELSLLPNQMSAVSEARYLTITGYGTSTSREASSTDQDTVWASNDPALSEKIDTGSFIAGRSLLQDDLSSSIQLISSTINLKARESVGAIAESIQQLQDEGRDLAARLDTASQDRLAQIAAGARDLEYTLNERLQKIADESVSSIPAFKTGEAGSKAGNYVFYKPILFRQGRESIYYRGMIRLSVSTEAIVQQIKDARLSLIKNVALYAAIALLIGILGSFSLSRVIVMPLMRVVRGIETIRDEKDKKKLADFTIKVKTRDELSILAGTINEMTAGLVEAAKEAEFLTVGKEVQKMFIPLVTNEFGEKLTHGEEEHLSHSFFGYYEGAKGVSGDYFDYTALDNRFWAFIKCDVSGKGVPAALIMVGVATIFTTELQGWSLKKNGIHLDKITYKINDFIERRGFKGRFAALIMGIYDSATGIVHLCHAGDNLVRIYEAAKAEVITHKLSSAPTAGTFSNDLVEATAPYKQHSIQLGIGDSLLLYTDGFEESSRARRDANFNPLYETKITEDREGKKSEFREALVEQLGEERIKAITEAIMTKAKYSLHKEDDPLGKGMVYEFDFSSLEPGPENLVMGLAAIEKVFRMIPDPSAGPDNRILVDSKVDAFLSKFWKEYKIYCQDKQAHPDPRRKEYMYYGHLKEDEQYDDLTMLLIRRNK